MAQKRVLVIGAILLAAGIGAPTTAFLTPGGALSEPRTPEVETPVAPQPPEPESEAPVSAPPTPPRKAAYIVPPGAGLRPPPSPGRSAPEPSDTRTAQPVRPEPEVQSSSTQDPRPPLVVPSMDQPDVVPPPPLPTDDRDPADQ